MKPLTERDIDTLGELEVATRNHLQVIPEREGWVMPMDCGGMNGSHHSYTLHKLAKRGLCDRKKYGGKRVKGSCRYRINDVGRALLEKQKAERRSLAGPSQERGTP